MSDLGNKEIMAENINRLMNSRGLDRKQLADAIDVKYTTLTDWVKGNTYPRIDKIEKLANYFKVSKADLVEKHVENESENETAKLVAAHIDNDTPAAEREQIINFIESLKKSRPQD
ncbi:helix-turn-helix transcriptional regulator [Pediococcus argentinicus]|uniref:helix-turn-helix domain-containing protein n=1 Tax=Pediococcus argentinicus TaxID=480391 RepID=UPI00338F248B